MFAFSENLVHKVTHVTFAPLKASTSRSCHAPLIFFAKYIFSHFIIPFALLLCVLFVRFGTPHIIAQTNFVQYFLSTSTFLSGVHRNTCLLISPPLSLTFSNLSL